MGDGVGSIAVKHCLTCCRDLPISLFSKHRRTKDGHDNRCKDCMREYMRTYKRDIEKRRQDGRNSRARYLDRNRSRVDISNAIKRGDMLNAWKLVCVDCGSTAAQWDHYAGYAPEHALDVEPVCIRCHGLRSRERGEHSMARRWNAIAL